MGLAGDESEAVEVCECEYGLSAVIWEGTICEDCGKLITFDWD